MKIKNQKESLKGVVWADQQYLKEKIGQLGAGDLATREASWQQAWATGDSKQTKCRNSVHRPAVPVHENVKYFLFKSGSSSHDLVAWGLGQKDVGTWMNQEVGESGEIHVYRKNVMTILFYI